MTEGAGGEPILRLRALSTGYQGSQVLWDVDLDVAAQQVLAIIGRNGVGKTTLLATIMGVQPASGGEVWLGGEDISALPPAKRARAGLAYVPQGRHIFPQLTVEENLQTGLSALGTRGSAREGVPGFVYDMFPKLADLRQRKGGFLSGGEQQQLAIGRAMAGRPRVLLLDEPTEGIQPNIVQHIEQALTEAARTMGVTVVVVEQYLDFVWRFAHRYVAMNRGRIVADGATAGIDAAQAAAHISI